VPTQHLRGVLRRFEDAFAGGTPVVSATKGIEIETFKTPLQVIAEVLGARPLCVLTGPSHAEEVARGKPASVVAASSDIDYAQGVQRAFSGPTFRVYTNPDPLGAEYGGALKNVIAIAAGIGDGLELGDNAKSALLVRGMVEIARFACARGARPETFFGLAGVGDLATTCFSRHSRNRAVGEALGRGRKLSDVLGATRTVAEGVYTTQALFGPEADLGDLSMPIAAQVHGVLFRGKDPREAVLELMTRAPAGEMDGIVEARA
jgi:glycerol-3-phosphate dehydrogenase (NAD(P)+)